MRSWRNSRFTYPHWWQLKWWGWTTWNLYTMCSPWIGRLEGRQHCQRYKTITVSSPCPLPVPYNCMSVKTCTCTVGVQSLKWNQQSGMQELVLTCYNYYGSVNSLAVANVSKYETYLHFWQNFLEPPMYWWDHSQTMGMLTATQLALKGQSSKHGWHTGGYTYIDQLTSVRTHVLAYPLRAKDG